MDDALVIVTGGYLSVMSCKLIIDDAGDVYGV
jgi:hypothetical protein